VPKKHKADTKVWERLREKVKDISRWRARVGVLDNGATADDGTRIVDIAIFHEFGTSRFEARSFLRFTLENKKGELVNVCTRLARGLLADKIEIEKAMKVLGAFTSEQVKNSIRKRLIRQELSPATIAARARRAGKSGGDENKTPAALWDTGRLLGSITFAAVREGE